MQSITLDATSPQVLQNLKPGTEIVDAAGAQVGVVVSPDDYLKLLYAKARERFSDEEVERLRQRPGEELSLQEVLDSLQQS